MKKSLHYFITFFIIITILITAVVLPSFAADLNPYTLSTNLHQIMGVQNYYYTAHSYTNNSTDILWSPHKGHPFRTLSFYENGSSDEGYNILYSNHSAGLILTRWDTLDYMAYIEYRIPLSFGRYDPNSDYSDFGFNGQFGFSVYSNSLGILDNNLVSYFDIDSVFFKGYRRDGTNISVPYEYQLDYNLLPNCVFVPDFDYGSDFKLLNLSFNFSKEDFVFLTDYINMDTLYIRIKIDMSNRPVLTDVLTDYGFTRLDVNTTESNFINIVGSINNLQLKIDTLIAAVNDNFSALFDFLESSNSSEQLNTIQQTIKEVNGSWDAVDDEIYSEYVESVQQTTDRLEEMGDALQNVVKPPTSNITNIIKPSTVIKDVNINDAKTFLSIIYDWETFLYIIGIVVALMTASYIIFGKKE